MDCAEAKLRIESYVADQLSAGEKAALESHLADCAECRLDGELTRASKSAPTTSSLPPTVPQEAAPRPSAGEWTIESIFGSASGSGMGNASTSSSGDAPASTPASALPRDSSFESGSGYTAPAESGPAAEPDVPLPAVLEVPAPVPEAAPAGSLEDAAANGVPGWQFEAADAKEDASPPEGSLFFAEEALSRTGTPAKAKSSLLRVVMWGAGGIVGLALLGFSIWFALTLKPPTPHDAARYPAPDAHVPPAVEPASEPAVGETAETEGAGEVAAPEQAPAAPTEVPVTAAPHHTAPREAEPRVAETAPPKHADPATPRPADRAPPRAADPATPRPSDRPLWEPAIREEASVPPSPRSADRPLWEPAIREEPSVPPTSTKPPPQTPAPAASSEATGAPPATTAPPPATPAPLPKSPPPAATHEATPAPDPIQRPIDRLHLATVGAEQNADLPGLRKLRETWRVFLRTSVGPDRARAKRELGDCLWAIQILTTRTSDQKAALVAYRDYLLNAPAGGADARTVSRMRQLEDALAEGR